MFKKWLIEVAAKISGKECEATEINCPHCNQKCIDYLYIGDEETRVGYFPLIVISGRVIILRSEK